jgi:hypothetical protein
MTLIPLHQIKKKKKKKKKKNIVECDPQRAMDGRTQGQRTTIMGETIR